METRPFSYFLRGLTAAAWRYCVPPAIFARHNSVGRPLFNNPHFRPTHPTPVVFVHGRTDNSRHWWWAARYLKDRGFSPWAFDYGTRSRSFMALLPGVYGLGDLHEAAAELDRAIDHVLRETGAPQVDLVVHSQGGTLVKLYTSVLGKAHNVRRVVAVGATFHGSTIGGWADRLAPHITRTPRLSRLIGSEGGLQQLAGSPFVAKLDTYPDTHPGIVYTCIYSSSDTAATPTSTSVLEGAANVSMGDVFHGSMITRRKGYELIYWGLTRPPELH